MPSIPVLRRSLHAASAAIVLVSALPSPAWAQAVLTVPGLTQSSPPPAAPTSPSSTPSAPLPTPTPAPTPNQLSDGTSPRTWVTLPKLGLGGRVEAFVGSPKRDDDNPEDDDAAWRTICHEPCGVWVRPGTRLRVNGTFRVSPAFTLPARPEVHVAVNPGRRDMRAVGIVVTAVSVAPLVLTSFYWWVSHWGFGRSQTSGLTKEEEAKLDRDERKVENVLKGTAVVAAVGIGVGAALFLTNLRTTISPSSQPSIGAASGAPASPRAALGGGFWLSPSGIQF